MQRREFLAAMAAAAVLRPQRRRAATLDPARLRRWVQPLPLPPQARADADGRYRIALRAADCQFHPDLPPTSCWTYDGHFPGPSLEAESGRPLAVEWANRLPPRHFLPVDPSLEGSSAALPPVRAVVHVHGARVPADSDGYPEAWTVPGQTQSCEYPNPQEAATLFYHDHTMGLGRLNVYAGLVGLYRVRDRSERALALPDGPFDIPLLICDRLLDPRGQLYYPTSGDPAHPWVPEVFGNVMLVNGAVWPVLRAEPRLYRFRVVNACNSRFLRLGWSEAALHVIGGDQGLLAAPVARTTQLLAPAERTDWLVDLRPHAGATLLLCNDGRPILCARVGSAAGPRAATPLPDRLGPLAAPAPERAARRRRLTLDEFDARDGNPAYMLLNGRRWSDAVTERPRLGETEIWELVNLTDDTHPIHLHMVRFRLLDRRPLDADQFIAARQLRFLGPAAPPEAEEAGWKDTVRCPPAAMTRVLIEFGPYAGRYVWHCHVLEHEANAMMRPYEILG